MALIPRRKKKKNEKQQNSKWMIYDSGEKFKLISNDQDISEEVEIEIVDDKDMVLFHAPTSCYYLLADFDNVELEEWQDVEGIKSQSNAVFISLKQLEQFYFFYQGKDISEEVKTFWCDDDLVFWLESSQEYFAVRHNQTVVDNQLNIPQLLDIPTAILCYKKDGYYLYDAGQLISGSINSCYIGDDLLVCEYEAKRWYLLPDYDNKAEDIYFTGETLDLPSPVLWAKTADTKYDFIDLGESVDGDEMTANFCDDDVVVYINNLARHYLMQNFKPSPLYQLQIPLALPNNTEAVWMKPEANKFKLYYKGEDISTDVSAQIVDGNLVMQHADSNQIFVALDYRNQPLNQFQAAVIMGQ
ncbi:MAG: hypothetical protein R6U84_04360 [Candidatus Cloacimonadales bacterium]